MNLPGYISVALIIMSTYFFYRVYKKTKSMAIFWLVIGCAYLIVARFIIVQWDFPVRTQRDYFLLPFYILFAVGSWGFDRLIGKYLDHPAKNNRLWSRIKRWLG